MNNRGQVVIFAFMLAVVVIILALALAYPVRQSSTIAYNNMSCDTTTNDYTKAACYVTDVNPVFFIAALIGIAGLIITARIYFA